MLLASIAICKEVQAKDDKEIKREGTEWCNIWVPSANKSDNPRVLIAGDSIAHSYYNSLAKKLGDKVYCVKWTTSSCVADPAFHKQLESLFFQYKYAVIHFNNGLHGFDYSDEQYKEGYEKALKYIKKHAPNAKIIIALTTPLRNKNDGRNPRVDERNKIVKELAKKYGATVNDLHSISKDHPEYYRDPFHYKAVAIELQAIKVNNIIKNALKGAKNDKR